MLVDGVKVVSALVLIVVVELTLFDDIIPAVVVVVVVLAKVTFEEPVLLKFYFISNI